MTTSSMCHFESESFSQKPILKVTHFEVMHFKVPIFASHLFSKWLISKVIRSGAFNFSNWPLETNPFPKWPIFELTYFQSGRFRSYKFFQVTRFRSDNFFQSELSKWTIFPIDPLCNIFVDERPYRRWKNNIRAFFFT